MLAYPVDMIFSNLLNGAANNRIERFLTGLVYRFADSTITDESLSKQSVSNAAELEDIRKSCQGDSDAYKRLIERHQEHVGRMLWRFSRDRTVHEELVQDVFVEAYLGLKSYRGKAPFEHWLSRIATRIGYRYWKQKERRKKNETFSLEEWDRLPDESEQEMDPVEAASLVHRLLAQLNPRDRLVLTLRYLEGCDVDETARRTGWTKSMVKVQTWRAKKRLQNLLAEAGKELME